MLAAAALHHALCRVSGAVLPSATCCCFPASLLHACLVIQFKSTITLNLLQIVKELTLEEKKMFLKFFTGSDR